MSVKVLVILSLIAAASCSPTIPIPIGSIIGGGQGLGGLGGGLGGKGNTGVSAGGGLGGGFGAIVRGVFGAINGVAKTAVNALNTVANIVIGSINSVFSVIINLALVLEVTLNNLIVGLGSLFIRLSACIIKIAICLLGLPGDRSVCASGWNAKFGVDRELSAGANIDAYINLFGLTKAQAQLNAYINSYTGGKEISAARGSAYIVLNQINTLCGFITSKQISKQTVTQTFNIITTISASISNSQKANSGDQLIDEIIPKCGKYFRDSGYPDITTKTTDIKKTCRNANNDNIDWNGNGSTGGNNGGDKGGSTGGNNGGDKGGSTGGNNGGDKGGSTGGNNGGDKGGTTGGNNGGDKGGSTGGNNGGDKGGSTGGNNGGDKGGSTGGNNGGDKGGSIGGNNGGDKGGSTGGNNGGDKGGSTGGNNGGDKGGSTGGNNGGDKGGSTGGNNGGDKGGSTGGNNGGDKGGSTGGNNGGDKGGTTGGNNGGDKGGSTGGNNGGDKGGSTGGNNGGDKGGSTGGNNGGDKGGSIGGNNGGDKGGSTGGNNGGDKGGSTGGNNGGDKGGSTGGNNGGDKGGSTGGNNGGDKGGSTGGNNGGDKGGSTGGNNGGDKGGSTGGNTGGDKGGSTGGNNGGDKGGSTGGNNGGDKGGSTGGNNGGDKGGSTGGNNGGDKGGSTGGNNGGDKGGSTGGDNGGDKGGSTGGNNGGDKGGSTGGNNGGDKGGSTGGNNGGDKGGSTGGNNGGDKGGSTGGNNGGDKGGSTGGNNGGDKGGSTGGNTGGSISGDNCGKVIGGALQVIPGVDQSIISTLINLKVSTFTSVINLIANLTIALGQIIDAIISGLGSILVRIVAVIFKIGYCVNGLGSDKSICTKDWNAQFGVTGDASTASDLISLFRLSNCDSDVQTIIAAYTKTNGSATGLVQVIIKLVTDLSNIVSSASITKDTFATVSINIFSLFGSISDSYKAGSGTVIIKQALPIFSNIFVNAGFSNILNQLNTIVANINLGVKVKFDWSVVKTVGNALVDKIKDVFRKAQGTNKISKPTLTAVLNIQAANSFNDVISFGINVVQALTSIIDVFISGLGSLIARMVGALINYIVAILGGARNAKSFVAQKAYYDSFGVSVSGKSWADISAGFKLNNCKADIDGILNAYTKNEGLKSLSGARLVIFNCAYSLASIVAKGTGIVEADLTAVFQQVTILLGGFANSLTAGVGRNICDNLLPTTSYYLEQNGYPSLSASLTSSIYTSINTCNNVAVPWTGSASTSVSTN